MACLEVPLSASSNRFLIRRDWKRGEKHRQVDRLGNIRGYGSPSRTPSAIAHWCTGENSIFRESQKGPMNHPDRQSTLQNPCSKSGGKDNTLVWFSRKGPNSHQSLSWFFLPDWTLQYVWDYTIYGREKGCLRKKRQGLTQPWIFAAAVQSSSLR